MRLTEVYKKEIEEAIDNAIFIEPKYIAIDESNGSVWVYEKEPYIPNYLDPDCKRYHDVDAGGLLQIAEGNYDDFEESVEEL